MDCPNCGSTVIVVMGTVDDMPGESRYCKCAGCGYTGISDEFEGNMFDALFDEYRLEIKSHSYCEEGVFDYDLSL